MSSWRGVIDWRRTHGTGCTYASAVAAGLALGGVTAAAAPRTALRGGAIAHAPAIGQGRGAIDHFWDEGG